jgi:hypothetical protein
VEHHALPFLQHMQAEIDGVVRVVYSGRIELGVEGAEHLEEVLGARDGADVDGDRRHRGRVRQGRRELEALRVEALVDHDHVVGLAVDKVAGAAGALLEHHGLADLTWTLVDVLPSPSTRCRRRWP